LISEVLNPFYIFQMLSVIFWFIDDYILYALCILVVSVGSVILALVETKKNHTTIKEMARYECTVQKLSAGR
jgi:cation-transporting P-type ATPase 13A2